MSITCSECGGEIHNNDHGATIHPVGECLRVYKSRINEAVKALDYSLIDLDTQLLKDETTKRLWKANMRAYKLLKGLG